jgi:uncharacterized protein (TIGR00304 family)
LVNLVSVGVVLVLVGIAVIIASTFHSARGKGRSEVKGAGVIMIGPIPIIFGTDAKWVSIAIVLAIVLVALGLLYYVV